MIRSRESARSSSSVSSVPIRGKISPQVCSDTQFPGNRPPEAPPKPQSVVPLTEKVLSCICLQEAGV